MIKEVDAASVYLLRGTLQTLGPQKHPEWVWLTCCVGGDVCAGAVNSTVAHKGDICDFAEAFNVIIDIPLNSRAPMESVMLYLVAATVDEYSLILPGTPTPSQPLG